MSRAINDAGNGARTAVVRSLGNQMGLLYGTVRSELTIVPATTSRPEYAIKSSGGYMSLRSFDAQQRPAGVSARPWGRNRVFRGTFIVRSLGGQVFRRTTRARFPIAKLWGPAIPVEMLRGTVPRVFEDSVVERLPKRLAHHIARLMPDSLGGAM